MRKLASVSFTLVFSILALCTKVAWMSAADPWGISAVELHVIGPSKQGIGGNFTVLSIVQIKGEC